MSSNFIPYHELEHTADVGLRVRGRTLEDLFANAALGMLRLMMGDDIPSPSATEEVEIELLALDREHLLVRWLSEILYLFREGRAAVGFQFTALEDNRLKAVCLLTKMPSELAVKREIKLVTHHNLKIEQSDGLLTAEVIFDI